MFSLIKANNPNEGEFPVRYNKHNTHCKMDFQARNNDVSKALSKVYWAPGCRYHVKPTKEGHRVEPFRGILGHLQLTLETDHFLQQTTGIPHQPTHSKRRSYEAQQITLKRQTTKPCYLLPPHQVCHF